VATAPQALTGAEGAGRDKKIGLTSALAFAVGAMIGGGVFTLSGAVIDRAGPGALVSYALAGLVMLLSAVSFIADAASLVRAGLQGGRAPPCPWHPNSPPPAPCRRYPRCLTTAALVQWLWHPCS
jgi:hypothetical protein